MKFAIVVVMLALAAGVQSSLIAAHAPGVSYVTTAAHGAGPWGGAWGGAGGPWGGPLAHGYAAVDLGGYGAWGHGGHGAWGGYPGISLSQGSGHYAAGLGGHGAWGGYPGIALSQGPGHYAGGHGHGHDGVYVAKTRGAIHTAPLVGHINSASSINVAPAPGTH